MSTLSNLLDKLTTYGAKWQVKAKMRFTEEEISGFTSDKATVVEGKFGLNFMLYTPQGVKYVPASRDSQAEVGEEYPLKSLEIIVLQQPGKEDILRIQEINK